MSQGIVLGKRHQVFIILVFIMTVIGSERGSGRALQMLLNQGMKLGC